MRILGLDTAARAASAAISEDGRVIAEIYLDIGLTHSETVLPAAEAIFSATKLSPKDIDLFAVCGGPGSFTGLRIGMAAVKAMAFAGGKPCANVSTLEALACNLSGSEGVVCAVMDARCGQVYTATFESNGENIKRITPDRAVSADILGAEIEKIIENSGKKPFLVGDGALLCYNRFGENLCRLAPPHLLLGHAAGVCRAALGIWERGETVSAGALAPNYLRLPQAEREKLQREGKL